MMEEIRERYMNPYTDFGFKKIFGTENNKECLISFLNALLDKPQNGDLIDDVEYMNTEKFGNQIGDRKAIFDIYCKTRSGDRFIVEMQKASQNFFKDRSIYYSTFPIQEQAQKGDWNYELSAVYTVGVLNFNFEEGETNYHHEVKLTDLESKCVFFDKLTFIYLEMPKFNKTEAELETMMDKWLFVLKNMSKFLEKPKSLQEKVFNKLFCVAEISNFSRNERFDYEESLKVYRDMNNVLNSAKENSRKEGIEIGMEIGLAKGIEKGLLEGEKQERLKNAQKLKSLGVEVEIIMQATGLAREEIDLL
ncbi:MAG: Rpn family recombination-promoting nuclease/putative transposase [Prevotellaceae bacterium]|nr:Rpn family recombination-promoting nuclease/putative transposase [Prevotellaceae bacterium]